MVSVSRSRSAETLQFAGSHLLTSLVSFNIGVELGQIFMLALMVPALRILFRYVVAERIGTIILSAFAAHSAWHWTTERYEQLSKFPLDWPVIDAAFIAAALRWAMVVVALAGAMVAVWPAAQTRNSVTLTEFLTDPVSGRGAQRFQSAFRLVLQRRNS